MIALSLAFLLACQGTAASEPLIGAHRGLGSGKPENTLSALQASIESGVDIIELDLRSTSDGAIVVLHDRTVDRTTDGKGPVSGFSLAALRRLTVEPGASNDARPDHVPSLAEVLELSRPHKAKLLLDIKDGRRLDLAAVIREARDNHLSDRIVVGVRRLADLKAVKAINPEVTTLGFVSAQSEIDAFIAGGVDIIRLWSDWIVADPTAPARIQGKGRKVWALLGRTVPGESEALQALHERIGCASVDAIITDTPGILLQARQ